MKCCTSPKAVGYPKANTLIGEVSVKFRYEIVTSQKYSKKCISMKVGKKFYSFKLRILSSVSHVYMDGTVIT